MDRPPEVVADALSRLGTTHLVTVSDEAAVRLAASPRFLLRWRSPPLAIFEITAPAGQPDSGALVSAAVPLTGRAVRVEPEHVVITLDAEQETSVVVAIGYSPKWHARLDGRSLPVTKSADGLLELPIPAGPSRLTLRFERDVWDHAGLVITLVTVATGARFVLLRRRPVPQGTAG
jgi:hypothetical protein